MINILLYTHKNISEFWMIFQRYFLNSTYKRVDLYASIYGILLTNNPLQNEYRKLIFFNKVFTTKKKMIKQFLFALQHTRCFVSFSLWYEPKIRGIIFFIRVQVILILFKVEIFSFIFFQIPFYQLLDSNKEKPFIQYFLKQISALEVRGRP